MIETTGVVETNRNLADGYRLLTLNFDESFEARAGQFAMLRPNDSFEPLLRRALAIYDAPRAGRLSFLYQVLGRGTLALSQCGAGAGVQALLPLGNHWPHPQNHAQKLAAESSSHTTSNPKALIVAGGIGSASLLMLAKELSQDRIDTHIFFGAASSNAALGCGLRDFQELGLPLTISTDDGSWGEHGFVTVPLARFLRENQDDLSRSVVYACGPWAMMANTARISEEAGVRCLVSLEAPMACGFGVCVGCVFAVKTDRPLGYTSYKRVCTDGTIFPAEEVAWEVAAMQH